VPHSAVATSAISTAVGLLDPAPPDTAGNRAARLGMLDAIGLLYCQAASPVAWAKAGMLSGIPGRNKLGLDHPTRYLSPAGARCQRGKRRRLLNDALVFLAAREQGVLLVSSNVADMDLLLRFRTEARVRLSRQADRGA
jgi:hypothetical protein